MLLSYSWPRTRQQLATSPLLPSALHLLLLLATSTAFLRALLLLALPTHTHTEGVKDKVAWSITRTTSLALELCSLLLLALSPPPSSRSARRALSLLAAAASAWGVFLVVVELAAPAREFHVYSTCTRLYGEGGGLFTALTALLLALLYSALLVLQARAPRPPVPALIFLSAGLALQALRALGGILLYYDVPAGICLTSLTLYLLTTCLPPLAWALLLRPALATPGLQGLQGRGSYSAQVCHPLLLLTLLHMFLLFLLIHQIPPPP